ncbi:MAG TPA: prepilin-type N-terminal cleavage/methylation domain-containing protein [Candidatus Paceibacterota bacterium]|nr:prepilin-type N-terminal cleavage/methylation domain-containing protein [Verrucomicrobiota bacterium]HOX02714.1 prepilin-type N-terminal cleavage/methylation domain-containing protein [Verrucomicrobiota bacterium]HRZ45402.1 prepilin-type N-terminal cleavage/methylation domain-containing protein [Candidatus Paceibacterota bacterium]HRZ94283.1 prepilin-type N-terminal cleavage/methylation domain-containing protein [Candidatus Paceibacterota bacterium]
MSRTRLDHRAFTLLEVMVAMAIFFMAIFSILSLVSQNLRAARALEPFTMDASVPAAELMLTNRIEEGVESGDFGDLYPGCTWTREITLAHTNGLYQVDLLVERDDGPGGQIRMSILLYRPDSSGGPGGLGGRLSPGLSPGLQPRR